MNSCLNSFRSRLPHSWFIEKRSQAKPTSLDQYKRTIAEVLLPDGMNIDQKLVKQGWCGGIECMRQKI
jgi:endonuclease YncB( thermonuclease family)